MGAYRFACGTVVATPAALEAFEEAKEDPLPYLHRHLIGDWGDLDEFDRQQNENALQGGCRIFSAYMLVNGTKVWIITEADRSSTCILLPDDY